MPAFNLSLLLASLVPSMLLLVEIKGAHTFPCYSVKLDVVEHVISRAAASLQLLTITGCIDPGGPGRVHWNSKEVLLPQQVPVKLFVHTLPSKED